MKSIAALLRQQTIGIVNLSLPILAFAYLNPALIQSTLGALACSLCIGLYLFYINKINTTRQMQMLPYMPTGEHKELLENVITSCDVNPETVQLRYGYTYESIAMAMNNMIIIDPLVCSAFEDDPEAIKIKNIVEMHIFPVTPELQKKRIGALRQALSRDAQFFIFKHELAHVFYNYSSKKIALVSLIGAISAYVGITTSVILLNSLNGFAILFGLLAAGVTDLLLSYSSNYFFKAREERNADIFAAQHSTQYEIAAAADFFEEHQNILDAHKEQTLVAKIPGIILSGHPNGITRANYLRKLF